MRDNPGGGELDPAEGVSRRCKKNSPNVLSCIGRQVRLLCPWARHLRDCLYLRVVRLVVTGSRLTRRPAKVTLLSPGRRNLSNKLQTVVTGILQKLLSKRWLQIIYLKPLTYCLRLRENLPGNLLHHRPLK